MTDETLLIISRHNAEQLSKAYNVRIETDKANDNTETDLTLI